ncbi:MULTISPECIES: HlyD family type I secretion periplasmic adaptor subunit [Pseudovibrio]|uniref:HlyD family type I secretion periplasmic adaptor subunit n=1 Tax=Stappiaceae TaxID=2821832 RepID=UPI0023655C6C|nr:MULTISPECIES: HlyD family type I secretion periplasmic adaptor subunit [Pseudovibrio]MDD7908846.1 HlyD family type I secretion periplasmic adaptor subunit [Pseudovibrio exalbescens]MDX5593837.1 HlyD family type I secretion periplasmic adaptor subunit [Pseudovibrio sp. SPO723]
MTENRALEKARASRRKHTWLGLAMVGVLVGGLGGWSAVAEISGAVIASGSVVVEGQPRKVQHQEGGIVGKIYVEEGDRVEAGDLLVRLDDTVVRANLEISSKQLDQLYAREARLNAEWQQLDEVKFPLHLTARELTSPNAATAVNGERALFEARARALEGRKRQLVEQISQLEEQIKGLEVQRDAKAESIALISDQLADFETLMEKRLVNASQVTAIKRDRAELVGDRGALISQIAQTKEGISERRIQILQLDESFLENVLSELQDTRSQIAQLEEQKTAAEDRLNRIEIISPTSGLVHQLEVNTEGGVVGAGALLMLIVPDTVDLVVETRVRPTDVDQVTIGQEARVRLAALDQRVTPELFATVKHVAPDLTQDEKTGEQYYKVRLEISEDELERLEGQILVPGMPVEGFIRTSSRTVLSYLLKPLRDQIAHALRES